MKTKKYDGGKNENGFKTECGTAAVRRSRFRQTLTDASHTHGDASVNGGWSFGAGHPRGIRSDSPTLERRVRRLAQPQTKAELSNLISDGWPH